MISHFMEHGYIVIKGAFTRDQAADFTKNMWTRLGVDPNDPSTWDRERIHMPYHKLVPIAEFAPKVRLLPLPNLGNLTPRPRRPGA